MKFGKYCGNFRAAGAARKRHGLEDASYCCQHVVKYSREKSKRPLPTGKVGYGGGGRRDKLPILG